jgi:molybdate transport system substrate-binding protein
MRSKVTIKFILISLSLLAPTLSFSQSELTIFVSGAMTRPMEAVSEVFESISSDTLNLISATTGEIARRVIAGEEADLIILSAAGMDRLQEEQLVVSSTRVDLAVGLMGMGMHPDGQVPDLSTVEAFMNTLLEADSLAYVSPAAGGTSGTYINGLIEKMGIAEDMEPKIVYQIQGSRVAQAIANGDAQYGITFISELLPNPGVKVVGPLPDEIQMPTTYSAAISSGARNTELAQRVLTMLTGSEGRRAMMSIGLEPLVH